MNNKRFFWFNFPIFYILHLFDIHSTSLGLSLGFKEANPLMVTVVQHMWLALLVKFSIVSILLAFCYFKRLNNTFYLVGFTTLHHLMMLLVVGHNYYLILKYLNLL
jgi:hypothetical protein